MRLLRCLRGTCAATSDRPRESLSPLARGLTNTNPLPKGEITSVTRADSRSSSGVVRLVATSLKPMPGNVAVRPVQLPEDEDFLRSVYAAARWPDLSVLGLSEDETKALLRWQFDAQVSHVEAFFPHATHSVVLLGGEAVGRLIVDRSADEIRVVEIGLLPAFRHLGIGRVLVRSLFEEADAKRLPVRCHVVQDDEARGFWEHVGFLEQGLDGVHVAMERDCEILPS